MTLLQRISAHAASQPEQPALTGLSCALSYRELDTRIRQWADWLRNTNIQVLGLAIDNTPDWVVLDLAAQQAKVCLVPIPPFFSAQQIQHALRQSSADALICDNPVIIASAADIMDKDATEINISGRSLFVYLSKANHPKPPNDIAKVTFTSGTTGEPKGVMLRQKQIETVVESLVNAAEASQQDRHLTLMPLAVLLENLAGVYVALWVGANIILPGLAAVGLRGATSLDVSIFTAMLAQSRPTTLIITPQLLPVLIALKQTQPALLESFRFIALGGAPVSAALLKQADSIQLPVYEGYGLSECASVTTLNTPDARVMGSVGKPLAHIRLSISDSGEVLIEGHQFTGYLGQPNSIENMVWASGDLGYLDEEGYLYLTGRKRNVFITAMGRNVSPEWVEKELLLEPEIQQVAIFGEGRTANTAVVVPSARQDTDTLWQAIERTNARLPDYARISHLVVANEPFTSINGQLSGTGRNRRETIFDTYRSPIEQCYTQEQTL